MTWFLLYLIPGVLLCIAEAVTDEGMKEATENQGRDLTIITLFVLMCLITLFHPIWFFFRFVSMFIQFNKAKEEKERWKRANGK
ncbi:hypothetical protein D3C74_93660 [compost metagenome]